MAVGTAAIRQRVAGRDVIIPEREVVPDGGIEMVEGRSLVLRASVSVEFMEWWMDRPVSIVKRCDAQLIERGGGSP
jgi:hypothetical protein